MPNNKRIILDWCESGINVYCMVRREGDGFLLDFADGNFYASPVNPYIPMVENSTIRGRYEVNEDRQTWTDGKYTVVNYSRTGLTSSPSADEIIGTGEMFITNDSEDSFGTLPSNFLNQTVESPLSLLHSIRIMLSALASKSTGGGTPNIRFRNLADSKDRISATVDVNGNRTAITLDPT